MRYLSLLALASTAAGQSPTFAPPVRLKAGDAYLGVDRMFPSPAYHDLDGDGKVDVVVGDLRGHLTVARRVAAEGAALYAAEEAVLGADGERVDLQNW